MILDKISAGANPPDEINVVIEVPALSDPVKYELDKNSGAIFVDRFLATPMFYPCDYGFIPNSLSDDGDPCDVLVISELKLISGAVISCKPIGVLVMEDESGLDEKILAVPMKNINSQYSEINSYKELPKCLLDKINHFFTHYKDLEKNKWVKVKSFKDASYAKDIINKSLANK